MQAKHFKVEMIKVWEHCGILKTPVRTVWLDVTGASWKGSAVHKKRWGNVQELHCLKQEFSKSETVGFPPESIKETVLPSP